MLADQMLDPSFPVPISVMESDLRVREVTAGEVVTVAPGIEVDSVGTAPPQRLPGVPRPGRGRTLVYATDTEHDPAGPDEALVAFARGADARSSTTPCTPRRSTSPARSGGATPPTRPPSKG
ncbi:MAG: hypothetical protein R3F43_06320 [bacterium]